MTGHAVVATGPGAASGTGAVLGYLDGRPIPRDRLDRRLDGLRRSSRAAALPVPESSEGRQLVRWVAQVILTEELCATLDAPAVDPGPLDPVAAVEYGSITAAAYEGSPAVRAAFAQVTAGVTVPEEEVRRYWEAWARPEPDRWRLRHRLDGGPWQPLGPVTLEELPRAVRAGVELGETRASDPIGEHEWTVEEIIPGALPSFQDDAPAIRAALLAAARRRTFAHWLDRSRAERLTLVEGLEHPGDPRQPDNHHKH
ncbi:DUF7158 domain-containing protein [Longispora urticae]